MKILGNLRAGLGADAHDFVNLYQSLGERSDNFLPRAITEKLRAFVHLCTEIPHDPTRPDAELEKLLQELKQVQLKALLKALFFVFF